MKVKRCPCINCPTMAMCRHRSFYELMGKCPPFRQYSIRRNGPSWWKLRKINKILNTKFEIDDTPYGKYIRRGGSVEK